MDSILDATVTQNLKLDNEGWDLIEYDTLNKCILIYIVYTHTRILIYLKIISNSPLHMIVF